MKTHYEAIALSVWGAFDRYWGCTWNLASVDVHNAAAAYGNGLLAFTTDEDEDGTDEGGSE